MGALRTVIFDFDGVIADTETSHLKSFQLVLAQRGFDLSADDYFANYLGYDDEGVFRAFFQDSSWDGTFITELVEAKKRAFAEVIREIELFPGVRELVGKLASSYPLAIASGALREEIEQILDLAGLRDAFRYISSTEDVFDGKPSPEIFLHALAGLNHMRRRNDQLEASECLVIEDSLPGIQGAHAAEMMVLAVANTHPAAELGEADEVVETLINLDISSLKKRLGLETQTA